MSNNNISSVPSFYNSNYIESPQIQPFEGTAVQPNSGSTIDSILQNPTSRKEIEMALLKDLLNGSGSGVSSGASTSSFSTSPELLAMLEQELNPSSSSNESNLFSQGYNNGYANGQQNTMAMLDSILGEDAGDGDDGDTGFGNNYTTQPNTNGYSSTMPQLPGVNQYAQANGGYSLNNPSSEQTSSLDSSSDLNLTGDPHENGTVNGTKLSQTDLMSSHDDLFDDNADINGGFQIGNTVGDPTSSGNTYTQSFTATVQGHKVEVDQNAAGDPTVTVDGKQLSAGDTSGPVTVGQDGSVTITGYNDANGASVTGKITEDSSGKGLDLDLSKFQNVTNAGGALIDQANLQTNPTS